jgi:phosphoglycerate dehydrogenase-like enzyme
VLTGDAYCNRFKEAMLKAADLRWLHTENSGIDGEFYEKILARKVLMTKSTGANAPEVAEFVFALILHRVKRLEELRRQQIDRIWQRLPLGSLADKTILVVGLGAVGGRVAKIARAFGLHVLGIRKKQESMEGVDEIGSLDRLPDFLARADIVVLALSLSPATINLLGASQLRLMREHVILVNIARGQIIDTTALHEALLTRPGMQACLDVLPEEPWPAGDRLWSLPNLFLTPHVAWSSPLYRPRVAELWLENLSRFRNNLPLVNQVLTTSEPKCGV